MILNIITVTKDDIEGLKKTIISTKKIREEYNICQIIIDSSIGENKKKVINYLQNEKNTKYYWQEPSGIAAAFNFGLKNVEADWVWFLNGGSKVHDSLDAGFFLNLLSCSSSDAIIFSNRICSIISNFQASSNVGTVASFAKLDSTSIYNNKEISI